MYMINFMLGYKILFSL